MYEGPFGDPRRLFAVDVDHPCVLIAEIALEHAFVIALLDVGFLFGAARIGGHVGDARAVGGPRIRRHVLLGVGQLPRFAAVGEHQIDLRLGLGSAAGGHETDVLPIRRPLRLAVAFLAICDLPRRSVAARRDFPNTRARLHPFLIRLPLPHEVEHLTAIRRDHRLLHRLHVQHIVERGRPFGLGRLGCRRADNQRHDEQGLAHGKPPGT